MGGGGGGGGGSGQQETTLGTGSDINIKNLSRSTWRAIWKHHSVIHTSR